MNIDNIQHWTINEATFAHNIGFAVVYHNNKVTLEWEDGEE